MTKDASASSRPASAARFGWTAVGLGAVGVGTIGIVLPGLPTTVFFMLAAWAFSKSSPRLEAWVLGLPKIGQMVQDSRDGLGMPRRTKAVAAGMIVFFVGLSSWQIGSWPFRLIVISAGLIGLVVVLFRVPTKESST